MAETSKNKIYYNDDENSVADVLTDMKKMAESTDEAIEKSKYDDTQIKKDISNIQKEQTTQNTDISNIKKEQETQNTNIEENNSKIVELQTEKAKLETELKEMQEDFYQNSIRGQASGEYIHVEDSSNCRAKIGISGNSKQETSTQGKNYFTGNKIPGGINFSVNYSFDNSILKLNGTATNSGNIILDKPTKVKIPAGTYTYTIKVKSGTFERPSGDFAVYIMSGSNTFIAGDYTNSGITGFELTQKKGTVSHIFNLTEEKEIYLRCCTSKANIVFNNLELEIQIESGSVYTEFEQFVPNMPSPDYLSRVKAVGSNVNMFNKDNYIKSKLYINKNENKFSEASMGKSFIFDISKYNKLTISKVSSERFGVFASVDYPQKDGVGTYLQDAATNATSFSYDFAKFNYLVVFYYFSRDTLTEQQILDSIKIVEGTETGEYSKRGQGCVKVTKCNKNLAKIDETNWTLTDNIIKNNGRNASFVLTRFKVRKGQKVNLRLKLFSQPAVDTSLMFYIDNAGDLNLSFMGIQKLKLNTTYTKTYIATKDCEISSKMWGNANADIFEFQFWAEIDKTTDYEQHEEQSYIIPTQSEMLEDDYFDFDNEEEVHTWNKLVLNGTEEFNSWTGNAPSGYKVFYLKSLTNAINPQGDLKCNTFKYMENPWESGKNAIGLQRVFKEVYISIESKYASTLEEFKAYLKSQYDAGTPVVVYYKLATPTRLKFTDEQKSVAKELNNARTYKNVTNITTDSKAILDLDYVKDQETQNQKMQNEIDEIKQLLSTTQTSALLLDNLQKEVESEVE